MTNPIQNLKLGMKLNLILAVAFSCLLVMILLILSNRVSNFVLQTGQERVRQEASLILSRFREADDAVLSTAQILGAMPELIDNVAANNIFRSRVTAQLAASQFNLDDISITDTNRQELLATLYPDRFDQQDAGYQQARSLLFSYGLVGINTTDVVIANGKNGHELLITGTAPIQTRTRDIIGSVLVSRRINERFIAQINSFRKDVHVALVYEGELLTHRPTTRTGDAEAEVQLLGGDALLEGQMLAQALEDQTVVTDQIIYDPQKNLPYVMAYAPFKIGGEIIGVAIIQFELKQLVIFQEQLIFTLTLIISLLAVAVTMISAVFATRGIVRPLNRLKTVSDRMAEGDYTQRALLTSTDEVGQLAQTFNKMAEAIQKRDTELRTAMEKATEAARVKGQFLATMSHELRTPLNAIIGFSDALLMGVSGELNTSQHHDVKCMRDNGVRLLTLINNVLDVTRIEAKRAEVVRKPFSAKALAHRLNFQMSILAQQKALNFTAVVTSNVPEMLIGDEQRIEQIAVNLLSNAFKFTEQGSVTLQIDSNSRHRIWSLSVTDTGIGIPLEARELIFEEFRQLDSSTTRTYKGSGLGLAITRNLVRIMDGQISVESTPGHGSTFRVEFPLMIEETGMVS